MKPIFPAARFAALPIFCAILALSRSATAQPIILGQAQNVAVLGGSTITNTGPTIVKGNVALSSPGVSITGFPPGTITGTTDIGDAFANQVHADAATAYTQLANAMTTTTLVSPNLGTLVLTPGVYKLSTAHLNGTLTLDTQGDPNAQFIFQIGTTLITDAGSAVVLLGGPTSNVFWQVGSSATLGSASLFDGNIFANTAITFTTGASLADGRALALGAAVTLDSNSVNGQAAIVPLAGGPVGGAYWNGSMSANWSGANWSPDASGATTGTLAPLSDVVFSVTGVPAHNQTTTLDFNALISSLTVNDSTPVSISGPFLLSIAGSGPTTGITINSGAGLTTINSNLDLAGASRVITVNNDAGLVINGVIDGTIGMTKAGNGVLTLTGANTYSGGTDFDGGTVKIGSSSVGTPNAITSGPLGTGLVTVNNATTLTTDGLHNYTVANNFDLAPPLTINVPTTDTEQNLTMLGQFTGVDGLVVNSNGDTGTLILTGNGPGVGVGIGNNYTGATVIDNGTVQAGTGSGNGNALSPFSDFTLNNSSTLDLNGNSETIASLNSSSTTTTVTNSAVTGPVTLTINDVNLRAGAPTTYEYDGKLTDTGSANALSLDKEGPGTLILTGLNTYTGNTTIGAGSTLSVGNTHALGSGLLVNHQGNVTNSDGVLETTATSGTLEAGFVPGPLVEKILVGGNYTQTGPQATGTGHANLSLQVVTNQGLPPNTQTPAAGLNYDTVSATGAASVAGTLNLNFQTVASTPMQGQQFQVISSATSNVTSSSPPTTKGTPTTGVSATGNVPAGYIPITTYNDNFNGRYAANNIVVTLARNLTKFPGLTPNQTNVAAAVDGVIASSITDKYNNGLGGAGDGVNDVFILGGTTGPTGATKDFYDNIFAGLNLAADSGQLGAALDELSPQRYEILRNVAFDNYALDVQNLDDEFARERTGRGGIDTSGFAFNDSQLGGQLSQVKSRLLAWSPAPQPGLLSDSTQAVLGGVEMSDKKDVQEMARPEPVNKWNGFVDGGVDLGDLDHNIDESHSSYTTGRVRGGADYLVTPNLRVGALFGYAHTDAQLDNEGSKARVDSFTPGLYATYADKQGFYANGLVTGSVNDYSTDRRVVLPGVNRTASGSTSGLQFGGDLDGGYEFHKSNWTFGPSAGLTYVNLGIDSFNESGAGAADLAVHNQSADSLRSRLGATVRYQGKIGPVVLTPHLSAFWQHEFLDGSDLITSQFQGLPGGTFSVSTTKGDSNNALLGFGLDAEVTQTVTLFIDYQTEAGGSTFFGQSASGGVKVGF